MLVLDTAPLVSKIIRWDKTGMIKSIATPVVTLKVSAVSDTGVHDEFYHVGKSACHVTFCETFPVHISIGNILRTRFFRP